MGEKEDVRDQKWRAQLEHSLREEHPSWSSRRVRRAVEREIARENR